MNSRTALRREAAISALINGVLSLAFCRLLFGYRTRPGLHALGLDCIPQAFMVSLMGSLVPALILRRREGGAIRPVVQRAALFAIAGALIAGGGAAALSMAFGDTPVFPLYAAAIKVAFGAVLGAIVAPLALLPLLRSEHFL